MPVGKALKQQWIAGEEPECCGPGTLVVELIPRMNHLPVLVVDRTDGEDRLPGLITTFDLL